MKKNGRKGSTNKVKTKKGKTAKGKKAKGELLGKKDRKKRVKEWENQAKQRQRQR